MTITQLRPGALDAQIGPLIGEFAVIALVPATEDRAWAAAMAWRVAKAVAATGRRTVLVDCFVNDPILHEVTGAPNNEGIVDAFEYGASLQRIAQAQPDSKLFFIPAGTFAPDPQPLTTHPRWRRLSAGFRHEEALLLLFCADDAVASLAADPDAMIVLAPKGMDLAVAEWPALAEAMANAKPPLLAVIADEAQAAKQPPPLPVPVPPPGPRLSAAEVASALASHPRPTPARRSSAPMAMLLPAKRRSYGAWIAVPVLLVALAIAAFGFRKTFLRMAGLIPEPTAAAAPDTTQPAAPPVTDTLPFAINVSQWGTARDAFRVADTLELHGWRTMLTPVRLQGRVWYRVYVGPVRSAAQADSLLADLRSRHLIAADGGEVLDLPLSMALPGSFTPGQAETERARLRAAGIPSFVLGTADGSYRLFSGAFDGASGAVLLESLLTPAGGSGVLGPRVGFVP